MMNDDNAPQDFSGFDLTKRMLLPPMPNFHNLLDNLTFNHRENALVEFKASHRPRPGDVSSKDACRWNVVKAVVAMANSVGGCILLGVDDDGNPVSPECGCYPDGVWKRRDEGHQLRAPLITELFKNRYDFRDEDTGKSVRIEDTSLERNLKKICPPECFLPCYDNAGSRVMAILVTPVPPGEQPILVRKTQFAEAPGHCIEESVCFFRDEVAATTESIVVQRLEWVQQPNTRPDKKRTDDGTGDSQLRAFSSSRRPYRRELWEIYKLGKLPPFALIPDVNHGFVGRKKELGDLRRLLLSDEHSVIVHGEGGSGKTELAIKFAHDCIAAFSGGVVFLNAERISSWRDVMIALFEESPSDLQGIKSSWKIDWKSGDKDESADTREHRLNDNADRALIALGETASNRKILLILDNVDGRNCRFLTEAEINAAFGRRGRGCPQLRILATARGVDELRLGTNARVALYPERRDEPLPLLDPESARTLLLGLRENVSDEDKRLADDISGVLEYHPWSLEIASGQLADPALSLRAFLRRIHEDVLRNESDARTVRNNPENHAALLKPTLDLLQDDERRLARIVSMFPADNVELFVLRRIWTDFMEIPAEFDDRDSFRVAIERLARFHVVSIDRMNETARMHRFTQRVLQEDMGAEKQTEADKISDFLAAWLGFTPFGHDRLRQFAENSILGQSLLKEVEALRKANDVRARGMIQLCQQDPESARIQSRLYYPTDDAPPLELAQFLENDENLVFGRDYKVRNEAFDHVFLKGIEQVFNHLKTKFRRPHWCYAYQNRGCGRYLDAMLGPKSGYWNFFDYLIAVSNGSYSHKYSLPRGTLTPCEWFAAGRIGSSSIVFERLGEEVGNDPGYLSDWTSTDFSKLTGQNWMRFLVGIETPEALERTIVPIDWNKLGPEEWLWLLNSNSKWEPAFSDKFGWNRLVRELCKTERQDGLIHFLNYHLEDYGDKFDWANLPVPTSAQCAGGSDWSGEWADVLSAHPELSDRITPQHLGVSFWVIYSGYNPNLIKDLREVRHPEWRPEIEKILKLALPESDNQ